MGGGMRGGRFTRFAIVSATAVLGLVGAVPSGAAAPAVSRYAGSDRFQTAADVSAGTFTSPVAVAFVARGDAFADALAGTPAAAADGGPVLLVSNAAIPPA